MKHCVITGASSGLGLETAKGLSAKGWKVTILCRNEKKAKKAIRYIQSNKSSVVNLIVTELTLMKSVRDAAQKILHSRLPVDVLINNAGCLSQTRKTSTEGWEYSNAINYLAPYLLTRSLMPIYSKNARIINVNSDGHRGQSLNIKNLNKYSGYKAYAHSKLTNALFIIELSKRYANNLTAVCTDPGAIASGFGGNLSIPVKLLMQLIKPFLRSPKAAARVPIYLATCEAELIDNAGYYYNRKSSSYGISKNDLKSSNELWDATEELLKDFMM